MSIFRAQPDFITRDPRNAQKDYNILWNADAQFKRYMSWLPPQALDKKRVLDLGCCAAAVGGYCLTLGAAEYVGIEISEEIATVARENLTKYHSDKRWQILNTTAEQFFDSNSERFDIVIASGIMHGVTNVIEFMDQLADVADLIVIESIHPPMPLFGSMMSLVPKELDEEAKKRLGEIIHAMEFYHSVIEYSDEGRMVKDYDKGAVTNIMRPLPSIGMLRMYFERLGYRMIPEPYYRLKKEFPDYFGGGKRFVAVFYKVAEARPMSFKDLHRSDLAQFESWADMNRGKDDA